tara:strand:+ start:317 stop:544 length:228 start_codon:yes stop_codon:yes gene_type:complete
MIVREATITDEQTLTPNRSELEEADFDSSAAAMDKTLYGEVTWRRACAAKRSIERMQEEQALKLELTDVFNENDV